ncbi:MAG TPA: glycoside hydrolase family 9 protein [Bacteroidota bacterium]
MKDTRLKQAGFSTSLWNNVATKKLSQAFIAAIGIIGISCHGGPALAQSTVYVDQAGYRTHDPKIAYIKEPQNGAFEIIDVSTTKSVYKGTIRAIGNRDDATGDVTYSLDFSNFTRPGRYQLWLPGASYVSAEFSIENDVYRDVAVTSLQSFYFQRCGTEVGNGTLWEHPPCHTNNAFYFSDPSKSRDVTGGWHDAGDYNKFVPTTAVSAAFILYLYERSPEKFYDGQLAIPEAANGVPDILDEARWGLTWLLKMQEEDGSVHHKVSIRKWTGEHLPQTEKDPQFIFDVSSASTADFAAVTAMGARAFEKWDHQFAQQLLRASLKAWAFLEIHHSVVPPGGFRNPPGVEGGEYGDDQDADERLWASVELYRTTGSNKFHDYFLSNYSTLGGYAFPVSWQHVQNFAYSSYLRLPASRQNLQVRAYLASSLLKYADRLLLRIEENGYRYVLSSEEYYWGSNSVALGYAYDLIQAYDFAGSRRYLDGALDQLHFMLGRNTFGISFVTDVGSHSVARPYHQFSMLLDAGKPVPGMVVAGANKSSRLRGQKISDFPGRCYEDNQKNYFVNETAINYTAPFVYLAGCLSEFNEKRVSAANLKNHSMR